MKNDPDSDGALTVLRIKIMEWVHRSGKEGDEIRKVTLQAETHEAAGDELRKWFGNELTEAEVGDGPFDSLGKSLAYASLGVIEWSQVARMIRDPSYSLGEDRVIMRMMCGFESVDLSPRVRRQKTRPDTIKMPRR